MEILWTRQAIKQSQKLPLQIRKKFAKQLQTLKDNPSHPSLNIKKMQNSQLYEGRINYSYRFTFDWTNDVITIMASGMHDEGLCKK